MFNIGDRVKLKATTRAFLANEGDIGTIVAISTNGEHTINFDGLQHTQWGATADLELVESKYELEIGDEVEYTGLDAQLLGLRGTIICNTPGLCSVEFYNLRGLSLVPTQDLKLIVKAKNATTIFGTTNPGYAMPPPLTKRQDSFNKTCTHTFQFYQGLSAPYEFCTKCDVKRDIQ